jgi:hypothetical protein
MTGVDAWACVLEKACSGGRPVATPTEARVPRLLMGIGRVPEALLRLRFLALAPTTVRTTALHAVRAGSPSVALPVVLRAGTQTA